MHCFLAECSEFEEKRERFYESLEKLEAAFNDQDEDEGMTLATYYGIVNRIQGNIVALDKQVMVKRKMLLEIEKESALTIASALRIIPKKEEPPEQDALLRALKGG